MSNWNKILITAVVCLIGGLLAGLLLRECSKQGEPQPVIIHDSITVHDTAYIIKHTTLKEVVKWDTCYLPAVDSGNHFADASNMVEVQVPITAYEYRDTFKTDTSRIELGVHFSGYKAKIDSIDLNYKFVVQPVTVKKHRGFGWSVHVGPYVGYGATVIDNQIYAAPSAGISVSVGWGYNWK